MRFHFYHCFVITFLSLLIVSTTNTVDACSGGAQSSIEGMLQRSDYVVRAHVVDRDELGQNSIIRVESYLYGGSGAEHLLLKLQNPTLTRYFLNGMSGGGDCLGFGGSSPIGMSFYVFIRRHSDGSYVDESRLYRFPNPESTINLYVEQDAQDYPAPELTESELLDYVSQLGGQAPLSPQLDSRFPLRSPLLIRTENADYMLPVDWQAPIEITPEMTALRAHPLSQEFSLTDNDCQSTDCIIMSPDNLNVAYLQSNGEIYLPTNRSVIGEALLFSSMSDAFAVWYECEIGVYATGYPRVLQFNRFSEPPTRLNTASLNATNCASWHEVAAWSLDGRLLAYADDKGIWLWDVFTPNSEPQQIASDGIPNSFSPQGRFLNVLQGTEHYFLDIVSGATFPDGVMSPDERVFVQFDTTSESADFEICSTAPYNCIAPRPMFFRTGNDEDPNLRMYDDLTAINAAEWYDNSRFWVVACAPETTDCGVFMWIIDGWHWYSFQYAVGNALAYDADNRTLAILHENTITINESDLDTSIWFDSDIQAIEWLPSIYNQP